MPIKIGIRFKAKDFVRWTSAVLRVAAVNYAQSKHLPKRCATEYKFHVIRNIHSFRSMRPYNPTYYKWKADMGLLSKGFWRLHDHLLNSLTVFKVQSSKPGETAYMGGIPNGIYAMRISMFGGRQKATEIALYGKRAEALRPLFKPTAEQYIRAGFWDSQLARSKRLIKGAWR